MKLYTVCFTGMYPTPTHLFIWANDIVVAGIIAAKTIKHTNIISIDEVIVPETPGVMSYADGDY